MSANLRRHYCPAVLIWLVLALGGASISAQTLDISPNPGQAGGQTNLAVNCPFQNTDGVGLWEFGPSGQVIVGFARAKGLVNFVGTFNPGNTDFQGFCIDIFSNTIGVTPRKTLLIQSASTVSISTSANPVIFGQSFSITVSVTGASTGDVTLYQDSKTIGTKVLSTSGLNGAATFSNLIYPKTGVYHFRAHYSGNGQSLAADTPTITINVISRPANGFASPVSTSLQFQPGATAMADFNGDGILDAAVLGGAAGIAVLIGNGDGTFKAPAYYPTPGHSAFMIVAGDFNGDGRADIALLEGGPNNFQVAELIPLINKGDGTFSFDPAKMFDLPLTASYLLVGDVNHDGYADVAVLDRRDAYVDIYSGRAGGLGFFGRTVVDPTPSKYFPINMVFGDFDGDGNLDLAVSAQESSGQGTLRSVRLLHNDGSGRFGTFSNEIDYLIEGGTGDPGPMGTGDLNNDGIDDLIVPYHIHGLFGEFYGNDVFFSDLTQTQHHNHILRVTTPQLPTNIAVTDVDGEGNNDVLFTIGGSVCILFGLPGDAFKPMVQLPIANGPNGFSVGDFNRDGFVDILYATNAGVTARTGATLTPTATTISVTSNVNPAVSGQGVTLTASVVPQPLTGAVIFYDGEQIIGRVQVANGFASMTTTLLPIGTRSISARFLGDNSFDSLYSASKSAPYSLAITSLPIAGFRTAQTYGAGTNANSIAVADFNGDGFADLAICAAGNFGENGSVTILLGNASGSFQFSGNYPVGSLASSIVAADFNLDGLPDIVVADQLLLDGFTVLTNNGDGTFAVTVTAPTTNTSQVYTDGLTTGDFNNDGVPDIAVSNFNNFGTGYKSYNSIFTSNRNGTFSRTSEADSFFGAYGAVAIDFNNDGYDDLVSLIQFNTLGLGRSINTNSATFQTLTQLQAGTVAINSVIRSADLNHDGIKDVVITTANGVQVFLGTGNGNFSAGVNYPAGGLSSQLVIADMNADGVPDLVIAGTIPNQLLVLNGNGDGTFQPYISYPFNVQSTGIAAGDFNRDGRVDIAATSANGVAIFYGNAPAPDLSISVSHSGNPNVLQPATYTIRVTNVGTANTSGPIFVNDTLPAGMSATNMSGTGWSCSNLACTYSSQLAPSASATITLVASVIANQASSGNNVAVVGNGADTNAANDTASDPTTITLLPTITVTVPPGIAFTIDGNTFLTSGTVPALPNSSHTLSSTSPQPGAQGTQYVFQNWSDGLALTHPLSVGIGNLILTGTFGTQDLLTTQVSPVGGGVVSPASGFYDQGSALSISAIANPGYVFAGFSGAIGGSVSPVALTLSGPATVVANFTPLAPQLVASVGTRADGPDGTRIVTINFTNSGKGPALSAAITSITVSVVTGSGTVVLLPAIPISLGTIAPNGQTSTQVAFTWPLTATRVSLRVSFAADGYSGSSTSTIFR